MGSSGLHRTEQEQVNEMKTKTQWPFSYKVGSSLVLVIATEIHFVAK